MVGRHAPLSLSCGVLHVRAAPRCPHAYRSSSARLILRCVREELMCSIRPSDCCRVAMGALRYGARGAGAGRCAQRAVWERGQGTATPLCVRTPTRRARATLATAASSTARSSLTRASSRCRRPKRERSTRSRGRRPSESHESCGEMHRQCRRRGARC